MDIGAITLFTSLSTSDRVQTPAEVGRTFDALVLEQLLRHSGITKPFEGKDSGGAVYAELMLRQLAYEFAGQMNTGFGAAMASGVRPAVAGGRHG